MYVSSFFRDLLASYQAEIDDLSFDSEGKNVFAKHRKERSKELGFLLQLIETNPEMLSALFHGSFVFHKPAVIAQLVGQDPEQLPDWSDLLPSVTLKTEAQAMAQQVLAATKGGWLLTVAAGLEYLHAKGLHGTSDGDSQQDEEDGDSDATQAQEDHADHLSSDDEGTDPGHQEAGADWLADQGFDRKDSEA